MSLNFDAEIKLNIQPFLASIKQAQAEVKQLSEQIDAVNTKSLSVKTKGMAASPGAAASTAVGAGSSARMAASREALAVEEKTVKTKQKLADASQQNERNIARERYALYDVAAAYTAVAGAAALAVKAISGTAIAYERSFADVQRTTDFTSAKIGAAAESAKNDLKALASEIPVAFGQVTQIATIGNQLGIAQGAITSFTETVAKFSATTGVSVDQTAMAFGRIGQLLGVPAQDFEKLGSSIAFAGVNAVATEEQILSVTKEIATTAKMAKFSSADIVGLATALSSLGIAPEAARGSIIRTFAGINAAITEGGAALESYANIAGMSAEKFSTSWQTNGEAAFGSFLSGLQSMSDSGQNLDSVLRDIGMKNVRDIQTIQKLGDNYDVYASSVKDANQGFREGTFLGKAYSVIQETVASKLQLVSNNFTNLLDTLGQSAVGEFFKGILDGINNLLVKLNQFAKSPVGQVFGFLVALGGTLITVIAGINAASALAQASLRAFATAQSSLIATTEVTSASLTKLNGELVATGVAGGAGALGLNKAKVAASALTTTLNAAKWFLVIGLAVAALDTLGQAFTSTADKSENILGGFAGLQDALRADLDAYNTALADLGGDTAGAEKATGVIAGLNTEIENNNSEINKSIEAQNALNGLLGMSSQNTATLSTEMQTLNFVIGDNTIAWLKNAIAQSESFQKMSENTRLMQGLATSGYTVESSLEAAASGNFAQYISDIEDKLFTNMTAFDMWIYFVKNAQEGTTEATSSMGFFGEAISFLAKGMEFLLNLIPNVASWLASLVGLDITPVTNAIKGITGASEGAVAKMAILGPSAQALNDAMASKNGEAYSKQLDKVKDSAGGAAKEIRTVVDYANDLSSVFARTFEINFGRQEGLDSISSGWAAIADEVKNTADAITKAKDEIAKANAEIASLTADKSVLQYQLTVAERYGDEARAAIIRAKIAKIDQDIAGQKENISNATQDVTDATKADNKADITKRALLLDQVKKYADLLEMYAKTGMKKKGLTKQTELMKEEFIKEATAMGISKAELAPYVSMFDDLGIAIKKTPRDVNVGFNSNISAADQAVKEYLAKLNKVNGTYTSTLKVILPDTSKLKKIVDSFDYRLLLRAFEEKSISARQFYKAVYGVDIQKMASGGPVTGPGSGTSDSVPAMLSNGEYVIKASAVSAYGVDFFNSLNQQKVASFGPSVGASAAATGSTIAYLSPEDRSLLRAVIDRPVNLYTENAKIASSANAGNVVLAQRGTN